ncbi:flippase [Companilactobacillus huachuanensis]|uniref:Flippase n=1 Tax=Companilactobacillus huachuanensis TaxID=2559914 RepID=A0ABW1RJJ6_9LACO|nr:flippase [Companilactobacillus huachuanensis]
MKVIKNYLYNAFYQVFILLVPFVTIPYLSRILGPVGVGINSYTNSIIQLFILLGGLGTNLYGSRQVAFVRDNREKLTKVFYEITIFRIIIFGISFFCFGIFMLFNHEYRLFYWAQAISIIAAMFDVAWFFMGIENFAVTVLRNIIVKIISLILIFTFVKSSSNLLIYILIISFSLVIGNLTLLPSLKRYIGRPNWNDFTIWKHLMPSVLLFVPQVSTQIYVLINKTLLGSMVNVQVSGYFDQSDKIIKMILAIVTATGTVMMPHVANAFAKGDNGKTKKYLYESFSFVSALSIPMMFGLMAVSSKFVILFFTKKFIDVIPIMMIESIVILLIAWNNALGTQYLLPTNQTKYYTQSVILGTVFNLVFDIPLIILWNAKGAAISTVISEFIVTGYQLWTLKSQINYKKLFKGSLKYFSAGFIMFLIIYSCDRNLNNSWMSIILEIIVGIIVYMFLLVLFKTEIIDEAKKILKH